jgi:hypothetical protein
MGCGAAQNQTPRRVKTTAFSGFTTAARQFVGKPTPTAFGQNQKQQSRFRFPLTLRVSDFAGKPRSNRPARYACQYGSAAQTGRFVGVD